MERVKVYFEAVALYLEDDVEAAVEAILTGSAAGINPNFAPPAPAFAGECRRQMNLRLRRDELERLARPALPPPDIEKTPEAMERGRAIMDAAIASLTAMNESESAEAIAASKARWEKVNARFAPEMSDEAINARLMKPRWTVGNDAEDAA